MTFGNSISNPEKNVAIPINPESYAFSMDSSDSTLYVSPVQIKKPQESLISDRPSCLLKS